MKRMLAVTVAIVLGLAVPAMAQNNMYQVKVNSLFDDAVVSATTDYATSTQVPLGGGTGRNIQGFFTLCWDAAGTGPDIKFSYQGCIDEDGTNCVEPYSESNADISVLIDSTKLVTGGGADTLGFTCVPSGQLQNEIGLFPWIKIIAAGIASNGADVTVDAWLIKH